MSVATQIQRIKDAVADAYDSVEEKGGTLPATENVANLATAIDSIQAGDDPYLYLDGVKIQSCKGFIYSKIKTFYPGFNSVKKISGGIYADLGVMVFESMSSVEEIDLPNMRYAVNAFRNIGKNIRSINLPSLEYAGQDCFFSTGGFSTLSLPSIVKAATWAFEGLALTELNVPKLTDFDRTFLDFPSNTIQQCVVKLTESTYDPNISPWTALPWSGKTTIKFEFSNCYVQYIDGAWVQVAKE